MEQIAYQVIFYLLAAVIVIFSIMTVTTRRILRAATYLLFVLFATAGIYFQLGYEFLGAVQITIYAGGIIVLYVFSILLTSHIGERMELAKRKKIAGGLFAAFAGAAITLFAVMKHNFITGPVSDSTPTIKEVGFALMGTSKYQYILPFEAISILLLACIIGGILIARKR